MSKIFISYASENIAEALAIEKWLKSKGWSDYFLNKNVSKGISPGEEWQEALRKATHRCEAVVCLISKPS